MNLTPNFTLQEMTISQTAERHGIDNIPNSEQIINLKRVCTVLEAVRATIGKPVMVSSGFRCEALEVAQRLSIWKVLL
jgi:zinc D-Ala-D-Ala carboxypeptidase